MSALPANVYAVVLAGGSGTRFWPKSRHLRPKQLCKLGGQPTTMLELTLARLDGFIPPERRLIVTHKDQVAETRRIAGAACRYFLAEPEAKNTANALALAAVEIEHLAPGKGPIMVSVHADALIRDVEAFKAAVRIAVAAASTGLLALLGVVPEYAETGYGYIEKGGPLPGVAGASKVASFREKPELQVAEEYVKSGRFYWNAGLFVWRVDVLLEELTRTLKPTVDKLRDLKKAGAARWETDLPAVYRSLPKISIDHAVLETSDRVAVVPAAIGWQDIGSWDALSRGFSPDADGNLSFGDVCLLDTTGTTIDSDGPFVAALGLKDLVVVAAGKAILVCPKDRAQEVKRVVDWLQAKGRTELL